MNEEQSSNHSNNNISVSSNNQNNIFLQQNNNNLIQTPMNQSDGTSNKFLSQQNTRVQGNFAVQGGAQPKQPMSQHSKVTSIIRRRTNNYDEDDEDFGMVDNYSQSSHTYIALQDKGEIRNQIKPGSFHNEANKNQDQKEQINAAESTIDMNFLHDINNECNYLITKFQDDKYVSNQRQQDSKLQQRMKSGDVSKRPPLGEHILQNDQQQTSSSKILVGDSRSSKTVGKLIQQERQLETNNVKKVVTPMTGKNIRGSGQQQFMTKDEHQVNSNAQTLHHQYNSGVISNSDQSERLKTAEEVTKTFDKQTNYAQNQKAILNIDSQTNIHDNDTLSLVVHNKEKKLYEESSLKYVSSYQNEDHSKYSISDGQSQRLNSAILSQGEINNRNQLNSNNAQNKLTFRKEENNDIIDTRNEYQLPHDDSNQQEPPIINNNQTLQINEPTAQFDMQNFSVLDRRLEGNSVDSSKEFNKFQDIISQQTPYSQNQMMFGTTQKIAGQNIYSDQDSNNNILSNREKRYLNHPDEYDNNNTNQQQQNYDNQDEEEEYEQDHEEEDDYQDDNNMPFSDNDLPQNQQQQSNKYLSNQTSSKGELLFTNNQHIFKQKNDSDDEDHKSFKPKPSTNFQQKSQNNLAFSLPQDDDNDSNQNNTFDMPQPPALDNILSDDQVYNRLPKKYFAQEDVDVKDSNQVLSSITQMRQDFIGYINDNNIQQKLNEIQSIIEPEKFIQKHFGNEDPTDILFEKVISPKSIRSKKQSSDNIYTQDQQIYSSSQFSKQISHKNSQSKISNNTNNFSKVKTAIMEEDVESSPDRKNYQQDSSYIDKSPQNKKGKSKNRSAKESARQLRVKSAKNVINPPDSSLYTVGQAQAHNGPRILKMADYFKDHTQNPNKPQDDLKSDILSDNDDKNQLQNQQQPLFNNDNTTFDNIENDDDQFISLNDQEKEALKQRMEQDILNNIDINFLFNRGDQLRFGLIDQQKAYKLMMKIKEVANQQLERGNKQIDYNEIVMYLQEEELYQSDNKVNDDLQVHPNSEPMKSKVPNKETFTQEMWAQVVDFMRKNPKLLMQMLPDETDDESKNDVQQNKSKNKVMQQIEEAKRWSKLQNLSKNFLQKRDLLDAIDNQQNYNPPQSPTKYLNQKEKKSINFKQTNKTAKTNNNVDKQNVKSPNNIQENNYISGGSDTEQQTCKSQGRTFQKQFQYNSTTNAKNIYQNPAFIHPDVNAQPIQLQQNSNRPIQSQQQTRVKSQIKIKKNSVMSTTMGDNTTLGTTAGNITNMNQYRQHNLLGSQNQTIDDANYTQQNNQGVMSMLQNYNSQNEIVNGGNNSQRRPITASAAHQNNYNNRSLGYMKPILQQRQDSFDMTTNKSNKFSRAGSMSKNSYAKRQMAETSEIGNQSAIHNYYSQPAQFEIMSGSNNLNHSFGGGSIVGQKFAPINIGPSRMTQKYINKIAPNLKENEMYPKILNKPRGSSVSKDSQVFNHRKFVSNESVTTPTSHIPLIHKRSAADYQRQRSDILNQSVSNASTKNNQEQQQQNDNYEQTPQGAFPKFVKPNALNRSTYSKKESNNELDQSVGNLSTTNNKPQKFINPKHYVNQTMQTRIGGINNKLLISPQTGATDPFQHDNLSRQDSQMSDKFSKKHLKVPIVDWAYTQLFHKVLSQDHEFNKEQDMSIYLEKEVDYVIDMMKNKYKDFKRSDIMRPFYLKALQTVQALLVEQGLQSMFDKMSKKYKEITIENTMKLLIRCKLAFHARGMLIDIINQLISYELQAVELKSILDKHSKYRIPKEEFDEIKKSSQIVFEQGHELLVKIKTLRSVHKQFKTPFIFKKKDYINYVKSEMNEIKKLISIFKVQGINSPTEQDDQNKYLNLQTDNNGSELKQRNLLKLIEENKNETEEQSYYSTDNQQQN